MNKQDKTPRKIRTVKTMLLINSLALLAVLITLFFVENTTVSMFLKVFTILPLTAHEIEHQSQYQNGDKKEVFERLVGEALAGASGKSDPYKDNKTLEYKAQQVQERANKILESRSMIW